jgi:pimeloyl-ACP methyl ester carboxylesterase
MAAVFDDYAAHPLKWWEFPQDSPTHDIPGFATAAADDGARTFGIAGQKGSGAAEIAEYSRYCSQDLPDVSRVEAPVFIYQGLNDTTVTPANADRWTEVYANVVKRRDYPEGGHDVQYRHWDQILLDLAGLSGWIVLCQGGQSQLVPEAEAEATLANGATLGICAWVE